MSPASRAWQELWKFHIQEVFAAIYVLRLILLGSKNSPRPVPIIIIYYMYICIYIYMVHVQGIVFEPGIQLRHRGLNLVELQTRAAKLLGCNAWGPQFRISLSNQHTDHEVL